jgi:hypothetical protein
MPDDDLYSHSPVSKERAKVFGPAKRCIYCPDGKPPFTREHVIPRGMGGGIVFLEASCTECQKKINEVETYCLRGPFLSHRIHSGLVNDLADLGPTIKMPVIVDGERREKNFPVNEYPKFLILPQFHDPPGLITGNMDRVVSFSIWGDEEELKALHLEGDHVLAENYDLDKFGRALAKIAHGLAAGQCGLENFEPLLPEFILGKDPPQGKLVIGNWPDVTVKRPDNLLHQAGLAFIEVGNRVRVEARIRLFAGTERTPAYRVLVGYLTKPLDDILAPIGLQSVPPSA